MLTENTFHINFSYALSDNITVTVNADIKCNYIQPCYIVSGLRVTNNRLTNNFENEIKIIPVLQGNEIYWLHTDSLRPSILSTAIGKAIEATGNVEMLRRSEEAA